MRVKSGLKWRIIVSKWNCFSNYVREIKLNRTFVDVSIICKTISNGTRCFAIVNARLMPNHRSFYLWKLNNFKCTYIKHTKKVVYRKVVYSESSYNRINFQKKYFAFENLFAMYITHKPKANSIFDEISTCKIPKRGLKYLHKIYYLIVCLRWVSFQVTPLTLKYN